MNDVFLDTTRCLNCTKVNYSNFSFYIYFKQHNREIDVNNLSLRNYSKTISSESVSSFLNFIESVFQEKEIYDMLCNDTWLDNYFFEFR